MQVYRSLEEAAAAEIAHPVVTLGVFDGVHVGHRYVIRECQRLAAERAGEAVVVTFSIHPRAIIEDKAPRLITSIEHRLRLFEELDVDHCLVLSFDDALRQVPALQFAEEVFREALAAELVILGHNCRFGRGREGDADFLNRNRQQLGFEARRAAELRLGDRNVSSSDIRKAIVEGDLDRASSMLGRPYEILGSVVEGDRRGREIGFPTANLDLHHELRPPRGVYGCQVEIDGEHHYALVNIGVRPTFKPGALRDPDSDRWETVEVHVLDWSGDLYGQDLSVTFLRHLRAEQRFEGVPALVAQIEADREGFLAWLKDDQRRPEG